MGDSSPLLSNQSDDHNSSQYDYRHPPRNKNQIVNDRIEQCIGNLGCAQVFQCILVSFAWAFDAQQTFISIFTDAEPAWHCTSGSCGTDICAIPEGATWEWDAPRKATIISEYGLQCANSFLTGLPASSFFIGCLIGGLVLATLADSWLGRKNLLLISCLAMSLSGIFTALFSENIWVYAFLRFVSGFGRAAIGTCSLVLATEVVGKQWRGQVGVIGFVCFSFGFLSLPGIAFLTNGESWRAMYMWASIPALVYCVLVFVFVRESPRWLLIRGRREEAMDALKNIATLHQSQLTLSFFGEEEAPRGDDTDVYSAMRVLMSRAWALRRLVTVSVMCIGIGVVYYGMPLALGNLPFNLYVSVTLNALAELPGSFLTFVLINRLDRKIAVVGFTLLSGLCSILVVVVGYFEQLIILQAVLEILSFLSAVSGLNLMLIFTIELFPTCVRNSAVSMARQALVFGGAFAPPLVAAGRKDPFIAYGVFGIVIAGCGMFAIFLPETRGTALADTMDEEEDKAQKLGSFWATH
ncbi:organic cation/carnitine transporter 3-like [Chenopodium quinoa]|uniref:Major facilitator superfamily (MFS) profile domain-containing protein n=1 Tax=Chenopodium quinoa TaxID=63459 RepID=A0A803L6H3_CHEQI|nr:organic cation/carnitine transporter 3-like [Chenopodium quinoa]